MTIAVVLSLSIAFQPTIATPYLYYQPFSSAAHLWCSLQGRVINFKNAVIILTSNIGSATILESMSRGDFESMRNQVTEQVNR